MPTVTITIAAAADDGEDHGTLDVPDTWATTGLGSNFAYVFQDAIGAGADYEWWNGSFLLGTGENIPAGATINSAFLSGQSGNDNSGTRAMEILVEDADPATNTAWSDSHLSNGATLYSAVAVGNASWGNNIDVLGSGETNETDIAAAIQSLVNDYGAIDVGDRINILFRPTQVGGDGDYVSMGLFERGGANIAELEITFNEGGGGFEPQWARGNNQVIL